MPPERRRGPRNTLHPDDVDPDRLVLFAVIYGRVLSVFRQDLGVSQQQAARYMGAPASTLSKIEVGHIVIAVHHLHAYADMLNHFSEQVLGRRAIHRTAWQLVRTVEAVARVLEEREDYVVVWGMPEELSDEDGVDYRELDPLIIQIVRQLEFTG